MCDTLVHKGRCPGTFRYVSVSTLLNQTIRLSPGLYRTRQPAEEAIYQFDSDVFDQEHI